MTALAILGWAAAAVVGFLLLRPGLLAYLFVCGALRLIPKPHRAAYRKEWVAEIAEAATYDDAYVVLKVSSWILLRAWPTRKELEKAPPQDAALAAVPSLLDQPKGPRLRWLVISETTEREIFVEAPVMVEAGARVLNNITCTQLVVFGEVRGDILASERVEIESSGIVYGNIRAPRLVTSSSHTVTFRGLVETHVAKPVFDRPRRIPKAARFEWRESDECWLAEAVNVAEAVPRHIALPSSPPPVEMVDAPAAAAGSIPLRPAPRVPTPIQLPPLPEGRKTTNAKLLKARLSLRSDRE